MRSHRFICTLLVLALTLSALTACSDKTPVQLVQRANDALAGETYSVEIDIDYHSVDTEVAGIFEQLERSETTLYFKDGSFRSVNDMTINDGDGDVSFHTVYTVVDGVLYSNMVYVMSDMRNEVKSKALIDEEKTDALIDRLSLVGDISADDFSGASLVKKDGDTCLSTSDVSEQTRIALERTLISQLEASSDTVKLTRVKLSVELDGKRYDTVTVDCTFDVTLNNKTYFVGMTLELEYDYDGHFTLSAPEDASSYGTVQLDQIID